MHYKIIKPLAISATVIALIATVFSLFIAYLHIEDKVFLLAKKEVKQTIENIQKEFPFKNKELSIQDTQFLMIALINQDNTPLASHFDKKYNTIETELKQIDHSFTTKSTQNIQEKIIHNHIENKFYFQFKIPIQFKNFSGSIKGLYQVPDKEIHKIYANIAYSIMQIIGTIFITTMLLYPIIVRLNRQYMQQSKNLLRANLEIMSVLGSAVAKRDSETNAHNYRVTLYTIAFAEALHLKNEHIMSLVKGAFLHDVGKIGISDSILLKPGKLTTEEFEKMKQHVNFGVDIISKSRWLDDAKDVIKYHHERYDGKGYNKQLFADTIPLNARIFMICDVFDALTSKRPYKESFSFEESIRMIQNESGTHFDPTLVSVFCTIIEKLYNKIAHLEDEESLKNLLDAKIHRIDTVKFASEM